MLHRILADMVVLLHAAFLLFVLLGGLLVLRWRWLAWVHLPAVLWGIAIEVGGWYCPLTDLENSLRRAAGQAGYSGGFIEHYLLPIIYPAGLTREWQLGIALAVLVGLGIRARRRQHRPTKG